MREKIAVLLLALLLTGCAAPSEEAALNAPPAPALEEPAGVESMRSSLVESSARSLLETEILAAYDRAVRVYSWFDLAPLPLSDETAVVEGKVYYRVDTAGIENLEDLRSYLRGVFSREVADRLLDGETARIQYREVDGALYASGSRRERQAGAGTVQVETEQMDETTYAVNVLVDQLDIDGETVVGLESWSFPYAFVEDRWVFTEFRMVY